MFENLGRVENISNGMCSDYLCVVSWNSKNIRKKILTNKDVSTWVHEPTQNNKFELFNAKLSPKVIRKYPRPLFSSLSMILVYCTGLKKTLKKITKLFGNRNKLIHYEALLCSLFQDIAHHRGGRKGVER